MQSVDSMRYIFKLDYKKIDNKLNYLAINIIYPLFDNFRNGKDKMAFFISNHQNLPYPHHQVLRHERNVSFREDA